VRTASAEIAPGVLRAAVTSNVPLPATTDLVQRVMRLLGAPMQPADTPHPRARAGCARAHSAATTMADRPGPSHHAEVRASRVGAQARMAGVVAAAHTAGAEEGAATVAGADRTDRGIMSPWRLKTCK
jgi:hypothetical protein